MSLCIVSIDEVDVKIENPDKSGIGEIFVKGDNITPGYRNNPEATAEIMFDDWMKTGDLGCLKDGHLWITGRSKSLIVSSAGKNIYPEELEEKLVENIYLPRQLHDQSYPVALTLQPYYHKSK